MKNNLSTFLQLEKSFDGLDWVNSCFRVFTQAICSLYLLMLFFPPPESQTTYFLLFFRSWFQFHSQLSHPDQLSEIIILQHNQFPFPTLFPLSTCHNITSYTLFTVYLKNAIYVRAGIMVCCISTVFPEN